MMEEKIIIAGFGGQGVLSLGQFIAYSAINEGKEVTWLPSYGPEMRGGTANCSVVVCDETVASPIIATPDTLIAMNKPSLYKFIDSVKTGGVVIVNSTLIPDKVERKDVKVLYVDAGELAIKAGSARTANIVVLGAYIKATGVITKESAIKAIESKFSKKPKVIPSNLAAFELGFALDLE